MTDLTMEEYFCEHYDELREFLRRRLGSRDLADDALHDVWLALKGTGVQRVTKGQFGYIIGMALNMSRAYKRLEAREVAVADVETLWEADLEELDPERHAMGRAQVMAYNEALKELPERQRQIFLAQVDKLVTQEQLAERFAIDVRTVQREYSRARSHLLRRLGLTTEEPPPELAHGSSSA